MSASQAEDAGSIPARGSKTVVVVAVVSDRELHYQRKQMKWPWACQCACGCGNMAEDGLTWWCESCFDVGDGPGHKLADCLINNLSTGSTQAL